MFECKKLDPSSGRITLKQSMRFSELAANNCPSHKAVLFSLKRHCRYDSTKTKDGPVGFKNLKVQNDVEQLYNQKGWYLKEPSIGNTTRGVKKPNIHNVWLQNYIDNQNKDINKRTKELERRINSTSEFYKNLNNKYSFRKMSRPQLMENLQKLNTNNKEHEEEKFYDGKILRKAEEIYRNLGKTKKKFKLIENYQKTLKALAQKSHELDFMNHHDKYMLKVLKKDRNVIEQFNNSNYKFPLYNTTSANFMHTTRLQKVESDPRLRYSFRSLSYGYS